MPDVPWFEARAGAARSYDAIGVRVVAPETPAEAMM
jgi:hypothetical protein